MYQGVSKKINGYLYSDLLTNPKVKNKDDDFNTIYDLMTPLCNNKMTIYYLYTYKIHQLYETHTRLHIKSQFLSITKNTILFYF